MKAIIDRFEGERAVLTPAGGGRPFSLPGGALPKDASAGDTVELAGGRWAVLREETEERRRRIAEKARRLFKD